MTGPSGYRQLSPRLKSVETFYVFWHAQSIDDETKERSILDTARFEKRVSSAWAWRYKPRNNYIYYTSWAVQVQEVAIWSELNFEDFPKTFLAISSLISWTLLNAVPNIYNVCDVCRSVFGRDETKLILCSRLGLVFVRSFLLSHLVQLNSRNVKSMEGLMEASYNYTRYPISPRKLTVSTKLQRESSSGCLTWWILNISEKWDSTIIACFFFKASK